MDRIWIFIACLGVICSAVPSLAQDSAETLFVLTGPEVLHAGTPTLLALTVFSDFPGKVIAEAAHDDTKVTLEEDFQGGVTRIITLPPLQTPASVNKSSLLNLTVKGYRGESQIFSDTANLSLSSRNVSSLIQIDRLRFHPGDIVRVRAVAVQLDNHPYKGRVDISIRDPEGNLIERWESAGNLGMVSQEFTLSWAPLFGLWEITVKMNGATDVKTFIVENYEPLLFEVLVNMPLQVQDGEDISGSVRAIYPSGQPVQGTLAVSMHLPSARDISTQSKKIYGSAQFLFPKAHLGTLQTSSGLDDEDTVVTVNACVTDSSTGFESCRATEVHIFQGAFGLKFYDYPSSLKPSLHFFTKLGISRYDRELLTSDDMSAPVVVKITQDAGTIDVTPTTLTFRVPEDGNLQIDFKLHDQVEVLYIKARFKSTEEMLTVYTNHSSPTNSYIQIYPVVSGQIGSPLRISVEDTFQLTELHFVVISRGQVVNAGTTNTSSFSLLPTLSWSPESCVTVYCFLPDKELVTDTACIPINHFSHVSLNWNSKNSQPDKQVSLTVSVPEPKSLVEIMVVGIRDDVPKAALDLKFRQECNFWMITNTRPNKENQLDQFGPEEVTLIVERQLKHWLSGSESLLWLRANVSHQTWTSGEIKVPDGYAALGAIALTMSDNRGLDFTSVVRQIPESKDFSLSLNVPSYLIRGEELVLEINIINHLEHEIEVILLLSQSEAFEFVLADKGDVSVVNAQKFTLGSHMSASALFPIRPVSLGEMEISVNAISAEDSESLVQRILVKPEGVEQSFSETLFLELAPMKRNNSKSISFSFPPDVVPSSQRAHFALVGDILALSIKNLDLLVELPLGCGEQNMIHFAPSVYVLQYLDRSNQDNSELRSRALSYIVKGYQRQLSYQLDDGSFSTFGAIGSTWLTAFVLRCFQQAQPYIQINQSVLAKAKLWLLGHQGPEGDFSEAGRLIHSEMQGGLDSGNVALTAYVLIALLEDKNNAAMFPHNVSMAQRYLESRVSSGAISNYSLCLVAYALALANSPVAGMALDKLNQRADYRDGIMMWGSSAGLDSHGWQPHSAQIEMIAYMMLAHTQRGNFVEGIALMKWLSKQRNYLGGYGTTQDTIVALQALAYYAAFSGASAIDLRLKISDPASSSTSHFLINSATYLDYQWQEINADKDIHLNIYMEGRGFAIFQMNVFYNLESKALSKGILHAVDEDAFVVSVDVLGMRDHDHMIVSICTRLKSDQMISHTGMAILDVGLLSGFTLVSEAPASNDFIRRLEILPEKITLYLDSLNKSDVCVRLPVIRLYKTAHVRDAVVQVYDYYEPMRRTTTVYNSDMLRKVDSCSFCGENCNRCRPGITITVSSLLSHSKKNTALCLSCLLLAMTVLFAV